MSESVEEPTLVGITEPGTPSEPPRRRRLPFRRPPEDRERGPSQGERALERLRVARRRSATAIAASLPSVARVLIALGAIVLLFVAFVTVFGSMRHTARQASLDDAFRARVAGGHAGRPNWRPLPGQAMATISIPAIDLFEVVVQDTTPDLLKDGPGHLLGSPLPGQRGNVVLLGRRVTDGAPFGDLHDLSKGDRITAVTPSGAFVYTVAQVVRVAPGAADPFRQTEDARMTLVTSASSFVPGDRTVVVAFLAGAPVESAGTPVVQQSAVELGLGGDPRAAIQVVAWALAIVLALVVWIRERRRIRSRWYRFLFAAPVALVLLFFLFENAENLLPGTI